MWKNAKPLLIILSVAVNVAFVGAWLAHTTASARPPSPAASTPRDCPLHRRLDLSEEQWAKIEPLLKTFRQLARDQGLAIQQSREKMLELLSQPTPDRQAILEQQEEILAGQRKMQQLVIEQLLAERQLLTSAQQQKLFDLIRQEMKLSESCPMARLGQGTGKGIGGAMRKGVEP